MERVAVLSMLVAIFIFGLGVISSRLDHRSAAKKRKQMTDRSTPTLINGSMNHARTGTSTNVSAFASTSTEYGAGTLHTR
jgi:hypothetical protein